jgi:HPt (histidine-containing phosphotransfer) domain-containing protein
MVSKNDYDVVLMDIEMPEMNGYMAAEKIRTTLPDNKKHIPILAMTAHASLTEKDKCLAAGMNDYVSKPFDPTEVKNKIIDLAGKVSGNSEVDNAIIEHQLPAQVETVVAVVVETPVAAKAPAAKLTDLSFLREMSDDDSFIKEFVGLFLQNMPISVADLEEGLKEKDYEKIRMAAHKMKPSLNYVGLKNTYEVVAKIEKFSKEKTNLDDLPSMIKQVSDECNIACMELEGDLKTVLT